MYQWGKPAAVETRERLLQWHYDKGDHGPDELWVSGERLLHWWASRRDQVATAFTARTRDSSRDGVKHL
ncbi:hypothetical protein AB0M95_11380 [Sphaerisporangium sp. NPDC051017]|uniref:hypothetical protein n=1 Tax=Sphaerisporangium sp. NPDC051017 TaxID=3154636 RepID=UPI003442F910